MKLIKFIATGLAGSTALTGLHQAFKNSFNTPRVDLLGKQAVEKMLGSKAAKYSNVKLYWSTLAGDIISNSLCYGIIAKAKNPVLTGTLVGTLYGTGTLLLPDVLGLNKGYVRSSGKKASMTVCYYAFGGLVAGIIATLMKDKKK